MTRIYHYVGPQEIAIRWQSSRSGVRIDSPNAVIRWARETEQTTDDSGEVIATFVVDDTGVLRIADRRSEHVACSGGRPVLSAGEISFRLSSSKVAVAWVTNQSTGFCPEPASWSAVARALRRAGMDDPGAFTTSFEFRRCEGCGSINIVKDGVLQCALCSNSLPEDWNLANADAA